MEWPRIKVELFNCPSGFLVDKPNLDGRPSTPLVPDCLGTPNKSSRLECGCSKWGWSASGSASDMLVSNGSMAGQPKHSVESDRCKNGCLRPFAVEEVDVLAQGMSNKCG